MQISPPGSPDPWLYVRSPEPFRAVADLLQNLCCLGNFAVCPYDDAHLKAQQRRPDPARPLILTCPACGKQFKLPTADRSKWRLMKLLQELRSPLRPVMCHAARRVMS